MEKRIRFRKWGNGSQEYWAHYEKWNVLGEYFDTVNIGSIRKTADGWEGNYGSKFFVTGKTRKEVAEKLYDNKIKMEEAK